MKCTIHVSKELVPSETKYGKRYACPVGGCTIICWEDSTSTPADYQTRQLRISAHLHFDTLWQSGTLKRNEAYKQLGKYLGLPGREVHIGCFNIKQCQMVIEFCLTHTGAR